MPMEVGPGFFFFNFQSLRGIIYFDEKLQILKKTDANII